MVQKNIQWVAVMRTETLCWWECYESEGKVKGKDPDARRSESEKKWIY